ncbi:alpha/beta fold hydrolase [Amycolatopsis minnesotensis]|uniref:Alpha/beta hydrolase n=1 Tax=Amycolatopsis minnesotensis TaxID=337894 RepID=A0ABN2Q4T1_9PSEU
MNSDVSTGACVVEDAELHVRQEGDGAPLLLVPGGLGAADSYRALAKRLSTDHTVLTYDRRGHFRSTDDSTGPIPVARHAADARAVIDYFGFGEVTVFGSSAGAVIALDLAARYPETVSALIAHEPPVVGLLPDAEDWFADADAQVELARSGDVLGAFTRFVSTIAGAALPDLRAVRLPNETEWARLFDREILEFYHYLPDIPALRKSWVDVTLAAGEGSRGHFHYAPARALALELGLPFAELPGAHLAPQRNPAQFSDALRRLLP